MKEYVTKTGLKQFKPSIEEIREMDDEGMGWCLACGEQQPAEPDARKYECESCGAAKVYGAAELALMGLYH
jgi:Zn finger protein HypA/HybF involved in hydrogenase expression